MERLDEALERRHEAEVVERLRTQLDREPADVLEGRHDKLAQPAVAAAATSAGPAASSTLFSPSRIDVSA